MRMPAVLGQEGAGVVDAIGEGVAGWAPGDRVYAGQAGAYAELTLASAARAIRLPDGVSFEVAAAGMLKGMTAEFLLRRCYPLRAGETILVHAAAGGVGSILVQWAKAIGATVIGTVGSAAKADLVRGYGCDHVILYRHEDVAARVREITGGQGVPVAYDSVGKDTFEGTLGSVARRGVFVSFGNASGPAPAVDPIRLMRARLAVLHPPDDGGLHGDPRGSRPERERLLRGGRRPARSRSRSARPSRCARHATRTRRSSSARRSARACSCPARARTRLGLSETEGFRSTAEGAKGERRTRRLCALSAFSACSAVKWIGPLSRGRDRVQV